MNLRMFKKPYEKQIFVLGMLFPACFALVVMTKGDFPFIYHPMCWETLSLPMVVLIAVGGLLFRRAKLADAINVLELVLFATNGILLAVLFYLFLSIWHATI